MHIYLYIYVCVCVYKPYMNVKGNLDIEPLAFSRAFRVSVRDQNSKSFTVLGNLQGKKKSNVRTVYSQRVSWYYQFHYFESKHQFLMICRSLLHNLINESL